jgi:hypothetical protein
MTEKFYEIILSLCPLNTCVSILLFSFGRWVIGIAGQKNECSHFYQLNIFFLYLQFVPLFVYTVKTVTKSNKKIVEMDKVKYPITHIHDCSLSWLGIGTSIKSGEVKLILWSQTSPLLKTTLHRYYKHLDSVDFCL